jgi:6-methylsalicylate decarboxylase
VQILSLPLVMPLPKDDPGFAIRFARDVNGDLAGLITKHPDRFGAFATLPMNTPEDALTELRYALDDLGLGGVTVPSNADGHYLRQPFWEPILA